MTAGAAAGSGNRGSLEGRKPARSAAPGSTGEKARKPTPPVRGMVLAIPSQGGRNNSMALAAWLGAVDLLILDDLDFGWSLTSRGDRGSARGLVGGEWGEVKSLVIGEVRHNKRGDICTRASLLLFAAGGCGEL